MMLVIRILCFACALGLSSLALGNDAVSASVTPTMATVSAGGTASANLPVLPEQKRSLILVAGILAVAVTFQRAWAGRRATV